MSGGFVRRVESPAMVHRDFEGAASLAALCYVSDTEPGIARNRHGKGFRYVAPGGRPAGERDIARIRALAIPPAWTDVWISTSPDGHIQATGRDLKGRKQYRYHPAWTTCRDEAKFSTLAEFATALPHLREQVEADLRKRSLSRERVIASLVGLLDLTMIRIGNDVYAKQNRSFGLTTLQTRHVDVEGSRLRFAFRGKSGQEWKLKLENRRIASVMKAMHELPGQRLFQYVDEDGDVRAVHSHDVNGYIQDVLGPGYSSKHFRTWGATNAAVHALAETPLPNTRREQARILNESVDRVAQMLRNTRAVCRRCYIHPAVPESWLEGRLVDELADLRRRYRRPLKGLDREETTVLRWLEAQRG
jgi:DNA topoisomerase I